ncbi:MAG: DegT/DnrJ/EryC1/StrS aminotransferase family protein [archaeon GW2011_AR19]|nr:MAG: DegT/DnrJ/EryC1/StrS aminotransferase family protein [archaeon GW2011_AR19]
MIWKVPYINLGKQFKNLEKELTAEFKRVMNNGDFILRADVKKFEENLANYLGVNHVIGVNSGTDALYLSTDALEIKSGDEVITVAHSFVATAASIVYRRAKPIFVDIGDDYNINSNLIEKVITKKTKAIMPVHLNGRSCEIEKIIDVAKKYGLFVIEDAAQALGAEYKGRKVGSFGNLGCFSLHPMKTLSCAGDGGFISTNNDFLADKIRTLRDHGQKIKGDYLFFGHNSRLDNLQAAILNVKFQHLDEYIKKRREIAEKYNEELSSLPIILPPAPSNEKYFDTYTSYVIRTDKQEKLIKFLRAQDIESYIHINQPLYSYPGLNLKNFHLKNNEKICKEILSLPIYPEMNDKQTKYVIDSMHKFFSEDSS